MNENETEFDVLLGGNEELPSSLSLTKFVACRSQEIQIMKNSLISQTGTKLAFQTIPKHMRRRAMSHNVKRLPRRLRQIHLNQMKKSGMPAKQKRPSRKYRRRPKNLVEEYTKRSSKRYRWLQTHIWHAKRFHMIEKWGYKLPHYPCDKSFRACYRAMSQHCLLQDLSYYNCIEVSGDLLVITEKLKLISKSDSGLSIGAKAYRGGNREGDFIIYDVESAPFQKAVGNVCIQWLPNVAKLWLWVHPALNEIVKKNLEKLFQGLQNVKLEEIGADLCRFRLTGPLSNSVLHDALVTLDIDRTDFSPSALKDYILSLNKKEIILDQCNFWEDINNIESTGELSPHIIISLIVKDPRLNFPKKRKKSVPTIKNYIVCSPAANIFESPLWNEKIRKESNENKLPDSHIANLRSKLLVSGSDLEENNTVIPVILIQRPGNKIENVGLGGGWDIILPSSWAKPFWIAFVMRGARVGGLRETDSILFEMGRQPLLQPDTEAGILEEQRNCKEKISIFFKRPPNKRINYNKFKISCPFLCNWKMLLKEWSNSTEDFYVLRDKKILREIDIFLKSKTRFLPEYPKNCLVSVKIECEKRGSLSENALICLPTSDRDFKSILSEPNCVDEFKNQRKTLRQTHQTLLKKFRKMRKLKSETFDLQVYKETLENYTKKMRQLWLPAPSSIRHSCSKEIMGFVVKGGFSFSHGKSCGVGYIVSDALPQLAHFRNRILLRNTNSRQYKVARFSVILE